MKQILLTFFTVSLPINIIFSLPMIYGVVEACLHYVFMHVHVHVCMYECMHECMYISVYVCIYACMYTCIKIKKSNQKYFVPTRL